MHEAYKCQEEIAPPPVGGGWEGVTLGIYWFQSRWYDGTLGRFAQPDSIVPTQTQGTQAWDRYAFVNNNPVRYNDPTGHMMTQGEGGSPCDSHEHSQECLGYLNDQMENSHNPGTYHTENETEEANPRRENDPRVHELYGQLLTQEEINLLSEYSIPVEVYLALGKLAKTMAQQLYANSSSGDQNAFQHTYWSALLAQSFGASFARQATSAHELLLPNNKNDAFKDRYNNEIGIAIGELNSGVPATLLAVAIMAVVARGDTLNLVNGKLVYSGASQ